MPKPLTCAVVVPSYHRPERLCECLGALLNQQLSPSQIIVVSHADDAETHATVAEAQQRSDAIHLVTVARPGLVLALETGMRHAHADVVAFTDDDARPHPDWLARLRDSFLADRGIAGVGGRDEHQDSAGGRQGDKRSVGRIAWFGRLTGNHHLGVGPPREVNVLKGVNCAYRRDTLEAVGFDHRLRGQVEHYNELALGLAIMRAGGRLIYDPAILVDHDEAPRLNAERVGNPVVDERTLTDAAYNEALILFEHLSGPRRFAYLVWSSLVGHRDSPGFVQAMRFTPTLGRRSWRRWFVAQRARLEARRDARNCC